MSSQTPRCWAVVPAAGIGERMDSVVPKQYLPLRQSLVILHTLYALTRSPRVQGIVVVLRDDDTYWDQLQPKLPCPLLIASGGADRHSSVWQGVQALADQLEDSDWVLVHDAVRPCLHPEDLQRLFDHLDADPVGGLLATPVRDTMKRARDGRVEETVNREALWHALTPQLFRYGLLCQALSTALEEQRLVTDEASAVESLGFAPRLVPGRPDNLKITRPGDLELAAVILDAIAGERVVR